MAASGAAFALPFCFPGREPVYSATWMAGTGNRAGAVGVAGVSLAVVVWQWSRRSASVQDDQQGARISLRWLWWVLGLSLLWTAVLGGLVLRAHAFWGGDEEYFVTQLRSGVLYHRQLYDGFEFPYGPLLYWWPRAFIQGLGAVGVPLVAAYLCSLAVMQAAGLAMLHWLVRRLPLRLGMQQAAFLLIGLGSLTPVLGINYTLARYLLPLVGAMLLARQKRLGRACGLAVAGQMLCMAMSPEIGVAFACACVGYAGYRAFASGWTWLGVVAACGVGGAAFAGLVGSAYFGILGRVAAGEYNLTIEPVPSTLALVAAAAVLAPLAVARRRDGQAIAFYCASLAVLPAAMGRCDAVHTFFNGIGLYLLALVAVDRLPRRIRLAWVGGLALVFLMGQVGYARLYANRLRLAVANPRGLDDGGIDARALEQTIGGGGVAAPRGAPLWLEEELTRTGQYRPGYFAGMQGAWDTAAETRLVAGMRQAGFALIPNDGVDLPAEMQEVGLRAALGFGVIWHARHPAYVQGAIVTAELAAHWQVVGAYGTYVLYRQR